MNENAFATVLGRGHPARLTVPGELDESADKVVDPVHLVEASEAEDGVDLLHLVDRDDATDPRMQVCVALHLSDHEAAGVLLLREQRGLLEVAPLGNEQLDRVPGCEFLLAHFLGVVRCEDVSDSDGDIGIAQIVEVDVLRTSECLDDFDLGAELLDLLHAELDA